MRNFEVNPNEIKPLPAEFFKGDVEVVAEALIGKFLFTVDDDGTCTGGQIIETEAYDQNDPAAHCYFADGKRPPSLGAADAMFGLHGTAYVYQTSSGCCLNFVTGSEGFGSAVLIRALKPTNGIQKMRLRHKDHYEAPWLKDDQKYLFRLCQGPVLMCVALGVKGALNEALLAQPPFKLGSLLDSSSKIVVGPRVRAERTIEKNAQKSPIHPMLKNYAKERHWRFVDWGAKEFVSEPRYPLYARVV
jgi:DNA-3-methyladenine glycosylase